VVSFSTNLDAAYLSPAAAQGVEPGAGSLRIRGKVRSYAVTGVVLAALAAPVAAQAGYGGYGSPSPPAGGSGSGKAPAATVSANGNAFSGGLSFTPPQVAVAVGDVVQWTNTDSIVPHTVTEDHGLFDLDGSYGGTPANPPGFAPGASVQREFAAGTYNYYCRVHPAQMKGTVTVPLTINAGKVRKKHYMATVVWAQIAPDAGEVFDLQEKIGGNDWQTVRSGTTGLRATFTLPTGKRFSFRSRLRKADDPTAASGYSPLATLKR
jgi:plastocyanin